LIELASYSLPAAPDGWVQICAVYRAKMPAWLPTVYALPITACVTDLAVADQVPHARWFAPPWALEILKQPRAPTAYDDMWHLDALLAAEVEERASLDDAVTFVEEAVLAQLAGGAIARAGVRLAWRSRVDSRA
jgi:hypothetical protein